MNQVNYCFEEAIVNCIVSHHELSERPAITHVLDELPRTETGKIRRGALKTLTHRSK
jgi:acyl-coenzyme A synthetase/AMP-(fatty) acid ligase